MDIEERRRKGREAQARYMASHPEQREKVRQRARAWALANPDRVKARRSDPAYRQRRNEARRAENVNNPDRLYLIGLRKRGVSVEQFEQQLALQGGGCWFCGATTPMNRKRAPLRRLLIDHDHQTGRLRGLLCSACNLSLGMHERGRQSHRLAPARIVIYLTTNQWLPEVGSY